MQEETTYIKIARYLADESSMAEKREIKSWIEQSDDRRDLVFDLQKIWKAKSEKKQEWNVDSAIKKLETQIKKKDNNTRRIPKRPYNPVAEQSFYAGVRYSYRQFMVAAVILLFAVSLAIVFTLLYTNQPGMVSDSLAMREVVTQAGERASITLDDGTLVRLNVDSRLMIPEDFGNNTRTVQLSGEAFFEVETDNRPFIVQIDGAVAEVLGTRFNIFSYENEPFINLAVADGTVRFTAEMQESSGLECSGEVGAVVVVGKGDLATIGRNRIGGIQLLHDVDIQQHTGWFDQYLVFNDTPLDQVARQLERWYGVSINFENRDYEQMRFTATFDKEPLYEILRVMKISLNLEYDMTGDREVTISSID